MTEPTLLVRDLRVASSHAELVHGLDLQIGPGERVGLIGESGAGKSVTASAIMGLLPESLHADGSVRLAGVAHELLGAPERAMSRLRGRAMSMVFQEPMTALDPLMTVGRQVAEVMVHHRTQPSRSDARRRAVRLLADMHLPDPGRAAQAFPHELSGGQRQRVLLAMALANDPRLLVCDEPTSALDVTVQAQVLALIDDAVRARGTSLLFITHDLGVVAGACERLLVLRAGRVVEQGPVEELLTAPRHPYTQALVRAYELGDQPAGGRGGARLAPDARPHQVVATEPAEQVIATEPAEQVIATEPAEQVVPTARPGAVAGVFSPAGADALIVVRDLTRTYAGGGRLLGRSRRHVAALRGVSFDVRAGERYGVVGESGSGKSTLLRLLCGLDRPTSGTVRVAGIDPTSAPRSQLRTFRRDVQIVFQDPSGSLDPRMRVGDVVAEPLGLSAGAAREQVAAALAAVALPTGTADRYPHEFSGGERQRISLARALITRPRVLLADEPVSALDVSVRAQVLDLLIDLVDRYRLTLVLVSHDMHVVRHVCDTVVVMQDGRIVEAGPTAVVYDSPRHPRTRELVAATPTIERALAARAAR